jgi:elongation factor Ts
MSFTATDVKNLREKTGAGMMACKEALISTNGDLEAAIDYLRKKGLAAAAKKQGRIAAEGVVATLAMNGKAVVMELNCETDFVSKGSDFQSLANQLAQSALKYEISDVEKLKEKHATELNELTLKCGEKLDVRRLSYLQTTGEFGVYNHSGRIGVIVECASDKKGNADVAEMLKNVSMHIAASNPRFLKADQIDDNFKKREAEIYAAQLEQEGKTAAMIPKIVEGKLKKLASEVCLLEQKYVKNPDITVAQYISEVAKSAGANLSLKNFTMVTLGEGIEKKQSNLADEVAQMTGQK